MRTRNLDADISELTRKMRKRDLAELVGRIIGVLLLDLNKPKPKPTRPHTPRPLRGAVMARANHRRAA